MSTILFLHGALGSSSQFESLINKLQDSYSCQAIDFPLHGNNSVVSEFTVPHFADYLIQTIEEQYSGKVAVFGYSMGGYVALYAAALRPDLFDCVMTLATKFNWNEAIAEKEKAMLNTDEMERKIPAFVEQLKQRHTQINWKEMIHQTALLLDDLGRKNWLVNDKLKMLSLKVMVGLGDKDVMVTFDETIEAYKQLKFGSLYILPNTKHTFEKVDEKLLITLMKNFFGE